MSNKLKQKIPLKKGLITLATAILAFTGLLIAPANANAAAGNILPPFTVGETWNVCEGYPGETAVYSYTIRLTFGSTCNASSSTGKAVRAPESGTVYSTNSDDGSVCVNADSGRSFQLRYLNYLVSPGSAVSAGQKLGTVASAGQVGNNGIASIQLQTWSSHGCPAAVEGGIPFDSAHGTQICGAPDMPSEGPGTNGVWSGTTFTGQNCGTPLGVDTIAFQANTGILWSTGPAGIQNLGLGMMAGTSPSLAKLANGQYIIAFQSNNGQLWTTGAGGTKNWGLGIRAGTSPSVTAVGNDYQIAFQSDTGLWTAGAGGTIRHNLGLKAGTSPSNTTLANGSTITAFQSADGVLWTVGPDGVKNWGLGIRAGTSPSVTAVGNDYRVAFQSDTGLWTAGAGGTIRHNLGLKAGTSPSGGH